jgi:hypothetical protein
MGRPMSVNCGDQVCYVVLRPAGGSITSRMDSLLGWKSFAASALTEFQEEKPYTNKQTQTGIVSQTKTYLDRQATSQTV